MILYNYFLNYFKNSFDVVNEATTLHLPSPQAPLGHGGMAEKRGAGSISQHQAHRALSIP